MKSPWNAYICLVTDIFWSCYCLRFEILRQEKNWYWSWRVMSQYFLLKKNQSTWSSYRFLTLSKQNKCKFFWLLNNMWVFRRLFMSKFNFRRWPMNLVCTPKISNYPAENKEFWEVKKKFLKIQKISPNMDAFSHVLSLVSTRARQRCYVIKIVWPDCCTMHI